MLSNKNEKCNGSRQDRKKKKKKALVQATLKQKNTFSISFGYLVWDIQLYTNCMFPGENFRCLMSIWGYYFYLFLLIIYIFCLLSAYLLFLEIVRSKEYAAISWFVWTVISIMCLPAVLCVILNNVANIICMMKMLVLLFLQPVMFSNLSTK